MPILTLTGCPPEPLGNYLKALGVFRLVAEQADPSARAWWEGGLLRLQSSFREEDDLHGFFRDNFEPSPLPSPWSVNSGWWPPNNPGDGASEDKRGGDKRGGPFRAFQKLARSTLPRLAGFGRCEREIRELLGEAQDGSVEILGPSARKLLTRIESPTKKQRARAELLRRLRNTSKENSALRWFDAVGVLGTGDEGPTWFPILGDGALEGVNSFVGNFYKFLSEHIPVETPDEFWSTDQGYLSSQRLMSALFDKPSVQQQQKDAAAGFYFPGLMEAPNVGQKFVADPKKRANPWDFILAMEGILSWSVATGRRLEAIGRSEPSFPFFCKSGIGGNNSLGPTEMDGGPNAKTRGELWLPLWNSPATYTEIDRLLVEGRVTVGERTATRSIDFALALAMVGSERGIVAFARTGLLQRSGSGDNLTTLAVPLGIWTPHRLPNAALVDEINQFLLRVTRVLVLHPQQPRRLVLAREQLETELIAFATLTQEAPGCLLKVLLAASRLERELAVTSGKVKFPQGESVETRLIEPVEPLPNWARSALLAEDSGVLFDRENPVECRLAVAIASLVPWGEGATGRAWAVGPIRENLLRVTSQEKSWTWDATSGSAVWSRGIPLMTNLTAVLHRRLLDAQSAAAEGLPLWSFRGASFSDLLALWFGTVNEVRLVELIHAFALIDFGNADDNQISAWQVEHDATPDLSPSGVWFYGDEPRLSIPPTLDGIPDSEVSAALALPRAYSLLKLCFLGGRMPAKPAEKIACRRSGGERYPLAAGRILNLLLAEQGDEALRLAAQQLRASGYAPLIRDSDLRSAEFTLTAEECRRLAGLLLIPARRGGVLAALSIKSEN
jgi:CRISPR-associated protein Csx17